MFNDYAVCTTNNALQEALLAAIYNKQTHYEYQLRVYFAHTLQAESFLTLYISKRERKHNCNMSYMFTRYAVGLFHDTIVWKIVMEDYCPYGTIAAEWQNGAENRSL